MEESERKEQLLNLTITKKKKSGYHLFIKDAKPLAFIWQYFNLILGFIAFIFFLFTIIFIYYQYIVFIIVFLLLLMIISLLLMWRTIGMTRLRTDQTLYFGFPIQQLDMNVNGMDLERIYKRQTILKQHFNFDEIKGFHLEWRQAKYKLDEKTQYCYNIYGYLLLEEGKLRLFLFHLDGKTQANEDETAFNTRPKVEKIFAELNQEINYLKKLHRKL